MLLGAGLAGVLGERLGIVATISLDGLAYVLAGLLTLVGFSRIAIARRDGARQPAPLI